MGNRGQGDAVLQGHVSRDAGRLHKDGHGEHSVGRTRVSIFTLGQPTNVREWGLSTVITASRGCVSLDGGWDQSCQSEMDAWVAVGGSNDVSVTV